MARGKSSLSSYWLRSRYSWEDDEVGDDWNTRVNSAPWKAGPSKDWTIDQKTSYWESEKLNNALRVAAKTAYLTGTIGQDVLLGFEAVAQGQAIDVVLDRKLVANGEVDALAGQAMLGGTSLRTTDRVVLNRWLSRHKDDNVVANIGASLEVLCANHRMRSEFPGYGGYADAVIDATSGDAPDPLALSFPVPTAEGASLILGDALRRGSLPDNLGSYEEVRSIYESLAAESAEATPTRTGYRLASCEAAANKLRKLFQSPPPAPLDGESGSGEGESGAMNKSQGGSQPKHGNPKESNSPGKQDGSTGENESESASENTESANEAGDDQDQTEDGNDQGDGQDGGSGGEAQGRPMDSDQAACNLKDALSSALKAVGASLGGDAEKESDGTGLFILASKAMDDPAISDPMWVPAEKKSYEYLRLSVRDDAAALREKLSFRFVKNHAYEIAQRSGDLIEEDLYRATYDDRVFGTPTDESLPDLTICLLIDESGSMRGSLEGQARHVAAAIAEAVDGMDGVSLYVYGFTSCEFMNPDGSLVSTRFGLKWAVRMKEAAGPDIGHEGIADLRASGGTPTASAIRAASRKLSHLEGTKLMIVVTDGGAAEPCESVYRECMDARRDGFRVIGLGVGDAFEYESTLADDLFGPGNCAVFEDIVGAGGLIGQLITEAAQKAE